MSLANSREVIKRLNETLFAAEERRLLQIRDQLIEKNRAYFPEKPHDGFMYKGEPFDPSNLARGPRTRVSVHLRMIDQVEQYMADRQIIENDKQQIGQTLHVLLRSCSTAQDMRDALPNCLLECLPELKGLPRTNEEAFVLKGDPRKMDQYQKILPRIEFYTTSRLLY